MNIISASRRTDIPAFFGKWFIKRLQAGYFDNVNPFNPKQVRSVSLLSQDVAAFVFWTKYPQPFLPVIDELIKRGYFVIFQYTLNDYPEMFEPELPSLADKLESFKKLSNKIGKDRVLWRYDPVIFSSETSVSYHLEKIYYLAKQLSPYTNRLTLSLYDDYRKSSRRLQTLTGEQNLELNTDYQQYSDTVDEFCRRVKDIISDFKMDLYSCSDDVLASRGITPGACVDGRLISHYVDLPPSLISKDNNQRGRCLCSKSVDMGQYDSCSHFCIYCYAYSSREKVYENLRGKHFLDSSSLFRVYH